MRLGGPMDGIIDRFAPGGARRTRLPTAFSLISGKARGAGGVRGTHACDPNPPSSPRTHVLQPWREQAWDARSRARRLRV